jgi:hypothetical protein
VAAICSSSRLSRPAKSGTFFNMSEDALATAELYTESRAGEIGRIGA